MGNIFQLIEKKFSPLAGQKVIKAKDVSVFLESNALLAHAKEEATKIINDAENIYEERKQAGYDEGVMQGKLEHMEKIMDTVLSSVEFIERIESTVVDVVSSSIRKIIGELDQQEIVVGIVRHALNNVRNQQKVIIRVAVEDEPILTKALALMIQNKNSGFIDIIADSRLKQNSCILESELGVIDASLDTQLKALEQAFKAKITN